MRQLFILIGMLLSFGACDKYKEEIDTHKLRVEPQRVILASGAQSDATFAVTASGDWTAEVAGDNFTLSAAAGAAGTTTLTISATAANTAPERRELGGVTFRITGSRQQVTLPIIQLPQNPAPVPQTLLIVLCGRGNLIGAFDRNITNALKAITPDIPSKSRILVFQQTGAARAEICELSYDERSGLSVKDLLKSYVEPLNSTDGATMTRILTDMQALAPAKQYGMFMGSHATGWVPSTYPTLRIGGQMWSDDYWKKSEGVPETRGFGYDNNATMDITTLAKSITDTQTKFKYIVFDACFMSSIEALYDLRHVTDQIVASPCEIMLYGFPYDQAIPTLMRNNGTEYDLQALCESFHRFYSTTTLTVKSGCIALTDCSKLEGLAAIVQRINNAAPQTYDPETLQTYEGLMPNLFYDLGDFIKATCSNADLLAEFEAQLDLTFPAACRLHTPTFYTGYGGQHINVSSYSGVSVSEPSEKYPDENKATAWYKATHAQ